MPMEFFDKNSEVGKITITTILLACWLHLYEIHKYMHLCSGE
jgi:hypothetical protein